MSRFMSRRHAQLVPFTPGEQPSGTFIKLNTNESPFPPAPEVEEAVRAEAGRLQLYCDPEATQLTQAVADLCGVTPDHILMNNGSDEGLSFAFLALFGEDSPVVFPDVTYGFYAVYAQLYQIPYTRIPLKDDFTIDYRDYCGIGKNVVFANPNAPTGLLLPVWQIEEIVRSNPDHMVVVDEAYVDFCDEPGSCLPLIHKYENLLITRTFSKSYSMSGGRLGFCIGSPEVIRDLNAIKYSTNPYNVNRMSAAAGLAAVRSNQYYMDNCAVIRANRAYTRDALRALGARVLDSSSNFLFFQCEGLTGAQLYEGLRARGVLIRYFSGKRTADWGRVTIGTREQMDGFLAALRELLGR